MKKKETWNWEDKGDYGEYKIIANGNKRRLIEKDTGKIIIEYSV